jgi:L-ribulokinase
MSIVAGIDFGTASVRVSIVHGRRGRLGSATAGYPVLRNPADPDYAGQLDADHLRALEAAMRAALAAGRVDGRDIDALAVCTTGSTVVAVDADLEPLGEYYLWCDQRAWREASQITTAAREAGLAALEWSGGVYSSEWGFAKLLHWLRNHPEHAGRFHTALEHCDLITARLCGIKALAELPRSVCAMGHKWLWNASLGGLPPADFLSSVDPRLGAARERLAGRYLRSDALAGRLCPEWAQRLGLRSGIPIPVGALDAHWDAVGVGCRSGDVVNVVGTSTCIMAVAAVPQPIPGLSGVVAGSIDPGLAGIEAGLSATGALFEAIAQRARRDIGDLAAELDGYRPGQTGLLRFAWDNGDRSVLIDPALRGVTLGWRLTHTAADELFAAIEGTAFHTRIILERLEAYGVPIARVINAGGVPQRNEVLNRVYANVLGKPILVPKDATTSLGSAMFALLAAGAYPTLGAAQDALCPEFRGIEPDPAAVDVYADLYAGFRARYFSADFRAAICPAHMSS